MMGERFMGKQIIHFKHPLLGEKALLFHKALKTIIADDLKSVKAAFQSIEEYSKAGYYAVGFVTYEAAKAFRQEMDVHEQMRLPYVCFSIYEEKKVVELEEGDSSIQLTYTPNTSRVEYDEAISRIQEAIKRGKTDQVNYTIRMHANFEESLNTDAYYAQLTKSQRANYTAHLQFDNIEIISASPELFFAWDRENIELRPMKGTIRRGRFVEEDEARKEALKNSLKDQAENKMIVDLVKEELSHIAIPGTIKVDSLFKIETYPTVHQMTSIVKAKTKAETSLASIFEALFPSGSITGVPKLQSMKLIKQLESSPREIYCGAIGLVTPKGHSVFNVPIRTVLLDHKKKEAVYGVGGGITKKSSAEGEFNEVLAKVEVLNVDSPSFQLLETMLLEEGQIFLLNEHLARMEKSARYFQFHYCEEKIRQKLRLYMEKYSKGIHKLRLRLTMIGEIHIEADEISNMERGNYLVVLAEMPIMKKNPLHYHKTTYRGIYEQHQRNGVYDTLLWNEEGYITEFVNGNVVYQLDGALYTPPVEDGALPGTFRERLIGDEEIKVRSIHIKEMDRIEKLWFINSVRKWVKVTLK